MATKKIIEVDVVNSLSDSDTIFVNSGNSLKQISKSNLVIKGADGKSAYAYAVEGGYTGTETEFAAKLAQETYSKSEIDAIMGAYINDINTLVGGEG